MAEVPVPVGGRKDLREGSGLLWHCSLERGDLILVILCFSSSQ